MQDRGPGVALYAMGSNDCYCGSVGAIVAKHGDIARQSLTFLAVHVVASVAPKARATVTCGGNEFPLRFGIAVGKAVRGHGVTSFAKARQA